MASATVDKLHYPNVYDRSGDKTYEITFVHPNGDWTWRREPCKDYQEAMAKALLLLPDLCRVQGIQYISAAILEARL